MDQIYDINFSESQIKLIPLQFPLALNEIYVLDYMFKKNLTSEENSARSVDIYKNLILRPEPKTNKSTIINTLKRLINPETMLKRLDNNRSTIVKMTTDKRYFISNEYTDNIVFKKFISEIKIKLENN